MSHSILIVEDDRSIRQGLERALLKESYQVRAAASAEDGMRFLDEEAPDLLILDLMLPGQSGLEMCQSVRKRGFKQPIVMLTALADESDKILGLDLGADDYVTKPFALAELLARVRAHLRRAVPEDEGPDIIEFGEVRVDFRRFEARKSGSEIHLPAKAFGLLHKLVREEGEVVSRDDLMSEVWGYEVIPSTRTVDNHVSMLRAEVEPDPHNPRFIKTVHGVGYRFSR